MLPCVLHEAEDDDIIRTTLQNAGVKPEALGLKVVNQKRVDDKNGRLTYLLPYGPTDYLLTLTEPPAYFDFSSEKGGLDYNIVTLGHPIGLTTEYPVSSLGKYHIKVRKGRDSVMKSKLPHCELCRAGD